MIATITTAAITASVTIDIGIIILCSKITLIDNILETKIGEIKY